MLPERTQRFCRHIYSLTLTPCVEVCADLCRQLCHSLPSRPLPSHFCTPAQGSDEPSLNLRGALLGSGQGMRVRASLAGFDWSMVKELHIIDWHAGQGYHTLAAIEALIRRDRLDCLKSITLVEADALALERARCSVAAMVDDCRIRAVRSPLPGSGRIPPLSVKSECATTLHLLGDAVDAPGTDLAMLAYIVSRRGTDNIVLATGACCYETAYTTFAKLLPPGSTLSHHRVPSLGFTFLHHPVSMRSILAVIPGETDIKCPKKKIFSPATRNSAAPDYDLPMRATCAGLGQKSLKTWLTDLEQWLPQEARIIFKPRLCGRMVDMAVISPGHGISLCCISSSDSDEVVRTADRLRDFRKTLALHLPGADGREAVRRLIRIGVIASDCLASQLPDISLPGACTLMAPDTLHSEDGSFFFESLFPARTRRELPDKFLTEALDLLCPVWHYKNSYDGTGINADIYPDDAQEYLQGHLRESVFRHILVKGGPGSGKTTALAMLATNAAARLQRVLVITPSAASLRSMRVYLSRANSEYSPRFIDIACFSDIIAAPPSSSGALSDKFHTDLHDPQLLAAEESPAYGEWIKHADYDPPVYDLILLDDAQSLGHMQIRAFKTHRLFSTTPCISFADTTGGRIPDLPYDITVVLSSQYVNRLPGVAQAIDTMRSRLNPRLPAQPEHKQLTGREVAACSSRSPSDVCACIVHHMARLGMLPPVTAITCADTELLRDLADLLPSETFLPVSAAFTSLFKCAAVKQGVRNARGAIALQDDSEAHRFNPGADGVKLLPVHMLAGNRFSNLILLDLTDSPLSDIRLYEISKSTRCKLLIIRL